MEALQLCSTYLLCLAVSAVLLLFLQHPVLHFMEKAIPNDNYRSLTLVFVVAAALFLFCGLLSAKGSHVVAAKEDASEDDSQVQRDHVERLQAAEA